MYYTIKKNNDGSILKQRKFKSYQEAWQFFTDYEEFGEVVTKDANGYICETLNSRN